MGRGVDRSESLQNEARHANNRSTGRFSYVDEGKLERMGITQLKLESGSNFIRIISPKFEGYKRIPYFGREIHIHTKIGADERTFLCLRKMFNEPCPVCELIEEIQKENSKDKRIKDLKTSTRYLFFVVDVTDESTENKGLRWLDAPVGVNDNVIELSRDRRGGGVIDVSDPDDGRDIEFTRSGTGLNTKYKGFKLVEAEPIPDSWLEDVPNDFEEVLKKPTYDGVASEMSGCDASSDDEASSTDRRRRRQSERTDEVNEDGGKQEERTRSRSRGRRSRSIDPDVKDRASQIMDEED